MKYSRLLKVTAPSTLLSCGFAVLALLVVEIALPLWEDPTEKNHRQLDNAGNVVRLGRWSHDVPTSVRRRLCHWDES